MFYKLEGNISDSTLDSLIMAVNELQPLETFDLYIRGTGGELGVADAIVSILNKVSMTNTLNVYGFEYLMSSHFHIFFKVKAHNKILASHTYGMIHKGSWKAELLEGGNIRRDDYDIFMKDYCTSADTLKELNKHVKFSTEEIKKFKNNQDVYIMPNRMDEMLEYNKAKTILKPIKIKLNENNIEQFIIS